jgi:hypothetical protein
MLAFRHAARARSLGARLGNEDGLGAIGTFYFRAGSRTVHFELLFALGAIEDDIHNECDFGCVRSLNPPGTGCQQFFEERSDGF